MALTPQEIEEHTFRERLGGWGGYDPDEVDAFLDRVVGALRALQSERDQALAARDEAQAQAGESEALLRKTLVSAQRTAEQTVADANADAERIRERAHAEAQRIVDDARAQAREIADAVEELLGLHQRLRQSLGAVLAEHAEIVERTAELPETGDILAQLRRIAEQPSPADEHDGEETVAAAANPRGGDIEDVRSGETPAAAAPVGWPEPPGESPDPPGASEEGEEREASESELRFDPPPPR